MIKNDIFHLHKGEMGFVTKDGIFLTSDSKDMFLFSEKKVIYTGDFKFFIDLTKITRFGGFQIRYFYDYENKVFYGIYFIHKNDSYEVRTINNNNKDYKWSFSEPHFIIPGNEIYKNGFNLFDHSDNFCAINIVAKNNIAKIYIGDKYFGDIDLQNEINRNKDKIFENIIGRPTNIGIDACITQLAIRNILYYEKNKEKYSISFMKENVHLSSIINFKPEILLDFDIDLNFLQTLCDKQFFNKIIFYQNGIPLSDIKKLSNRYEICLCTQNEKNRTKAMCMCHDHFLFIVNKKMDCEKIVDILSDLRDNHCYLFFERTDDFVHFNDISFMRKDMVRQYLLEMEDKLAMI